MLDFAIELLEEEAKKLEKILKQQNQEKADMPTARILMSKIKQLKQGAKLLKTKQRMKQNTMTD